MKLLSNQKAVVGFIYVIAMFMSALDATIINVALPTIAADLRVAPSQAGSVNIGYLISLAMFLPAVGWLGDRFGTKRVFLGALSIFTLASILCGFSDSLIILTIFRVVQGIGAGLLTPTGMAILFRTFSHEERPKVSRMLVVPIALAPALGPVIGGVFVDQLSWRWVFFINIPFGTLALLIGSLFLHEQVKSIAKTFDIKGFFLSISGFGLFVYALVQGPALGWYSPLVLVTGAFGLILLVTLGIVESRIDQPILELRLLKEPSFRYMSMIALFTAAALLGMLYVFPLMYQNALDKSALDTGLTSFPEAIGLMAASQLMPWTMKRLGTRKLLLVSLTASFFTFLLLTIAVSSDPWLVRMLMFSVGFCLGHAVGASQITAFANITPSQMSRATTLFQVQNRLGSVLGVAILSSVLSMNKSVNVSFHSYQWAMGGASLFLLLSFVTAMKYKEEKAERKQSAAENVQAAK
ncbi:DHA2 family efflux MFS transporter permease subunit [Halobacillus salinarum]|uniref:DHA2 family efflux MFS transporter permease subunit n=1 Tax=Halobacillus salinarum TaxID=2932257 RepID=A0ABY4EEY8_9BACI|nr:DHA2 family efflux MFS transporter permease subunit [Halobacillus salinarum]UOQ42597.1 DHA2 family efflux MFS transporter permease subunit [Halobacillus salinarum]